MSKTRSTKVWPEWRRAGLHQRQRMPRVAPGCGQPRLISRLGRTGRSYRACFQHRRGGQPARVGARLPQLRVRGGRDPVHLARAQRDTDSGHCTPLAQLRSERRARPAHAALRSPRACRREVGDEHMVSSAAAHVIASGGRATAVAGTATHADDAVSRGHRVSIIA